MNYLHKKAIKVGGGVYMLIGNHELMNILGDFRYADTGHIDGFGGVEKRRELFRPGGKMAQRLACHTCGIMKIGSWVFVHGGFLPKYAKVRTNFDNMDRNQLNDVFRTKKIWS